ncbi:threonine--tRNA ligase [Buchnera aphidicola]|uniref:threonine--tRNA ligase n=1 Tax=Buchnera aphidicola TaxID=9 RepID=UPI0031B85CD0
MIKHKDHRIINKNMHLYHKQSESPGMIFWHSNGLIVFRELENFIRTQLIKWKYEEVKTPIILHENFWEKSGHLDYFKESMFFTAMENKKYYLKPMNCPAHIQVFNKYLKSYRDLPVRIAEFGICHRNEPSGSLYGLLRLKSFTQDDAHIFCTEDQIQSEIINCIKMIFDCYSVFGFKNIRVKFSTRPNKSIGTDDIWNRAEISLKNALLQTKTKFDHQDGEGAFYGPKIEFILEDCFKRLWQCGTIQLDFYLPSRFNSCYIDCNNTRQIPIVIHRAILGSIERFIGILLEEYSGFFPIWLSPVQVVVINVNHDHIFYVKSVFSQLLSENIRVKYDVKPEKINFKIRKYTLACVPYILICGDKEVYHKKISVRYKNRIMKLIDIDVFIKNIKHKIENRIL